MRTKVTNTSGQRRFFGFLPPHGKTLNNNGEVILDGDLRTVLASGMDRYSRRPELTSLDRAVAAGDVMVEEEADPQPSSSL